jgi:hypothetical protein
MLTAANAIAVQEEVKKLSHLPSGNHGRTFRRFLERMLQGPNLALAFADGTTPLEPTQFKLVKKYAEQHLEKLTGPGRRFDDVVGAAVVADAKRSYVAVHIPMEGVTETMSQNAMRSLVYTVGILAETMGAFAKNPAAELHSVSKEGIAERRREEAAQAKAREQRFNQALNRMFAN